jgi:hypothetical protein
VISQHCSAHLGSVNATNATINPFLPGTTQLTSLLSALLIEQPDDPKIFLDNSTAEKYFEAIRKMLDQWNILHDGVSLEGIFFIDDPFSFVAGTNILISDDES